MKNSENIKESDPYNFLLLSLYSKPIFTKL